VPALPSLGVLILVATDADEVLAEIDAAVGGAGVDIVRVRDGRAVRASVIEHDPDVVVLDMQIGSMGGVAVAIDLRNEAGGGRLDDQLIVLLLDRAADVFLAEQSGADRWITKPLDHLTISSVIEELAASD